jgi:hypothetical protein
MILSPTDVSFYDTHDTATLIELRERCHADSAHMALNGGGKLAIECEVMAMAITIQLIMRGEE